jgi:hypothetical protein
MNTKVLYIVTLLVTSLLSTVAAQNQQAVPRATKKAVFVDFTTQTAVLAEIRPGPSPDGKQVVRTMKISTGRFGMDTPPSPQDGWLIGEKYPKRWSKKYGCWMYHAVNLGIKNSAGQDDGDYAHEGRVPRGGYAASHGCMRLLAEDAPFFYQWVETGVTRVFTTGSAREHLEKNFDGWKLLEFNPDGSIKGFIRNPDGSLTDAFMDYARKGLIDVNRQDANGNIVSADEGVMGFEFFDKPWKQGVPKKEFEDAQMATFKKAFGSLYQGQ